MTVFFTSDLHFGHQAVIRFCDRPFKDIKHMEDELVKRMNSRVKPTDTLVMVGDMFFTTAKERERILGRLNGTKILVQGNHDKGSGQISGYDLVTTYMEMRIAGKKVEIKHYPLKWTRWQKIKNFFKDPSSIRKRKPRYLDRMKENEGQYAIHGHTHSSVAFDGNQIHVGVDAWDYYPVSMKQIVSHIHKQESKKKCYKNK